MQLVMLVHDTNRLRITDGQAKGVISNKGCLKQVSGESAIKLNTVMYFSVI